MIDLVQRSVTAERTERVVTDNGPCYLAVGFIAPKGVALSHPAMHPVSKCAFAEHPRLRVIHCPSITFRAHSSDRVILGGSRLRLVDRNTNPGIGNRPALPVERCDAAGR